MLLLKSTNYTLSLSFISLSIWPPFDFEEPFGNNWLYSRFSVDNLSSMILLDGMNFGIDYYTPIWIVDSFLIINWLMENINN